MIFPEGTTNNGLDMMHFKRGAFEDEAPVKIYGLEFPGDVSPSKDLMTEIETAFFIFANWNFPVIIHEFDNFDPKYTIDRLNLIPKHTDNWEHIVNDIRYLMDYGFGLMSKGNSSYRKKNIVEVEYSKRRGISYEVRPL